MLDKLLKEVVMLIFYDCDKNLSEIDLKLQYEIEHSVNP